MSRKNVKIFVLIMLLGSAVLGVFMGLVLYKYVVKNRVSTNENSASTDIQEEQDTPLAGSNESSEQSLPDYQSEADSKQEGEPNTSSLMTEDKGNKSGWIALAAGDIDPPPVPEVDAAEVIESDEYVTGMQNAVQAFYDQCNSRFPEAEDDLVRYTLMDIDGDEIPELLMHDVTGDCAYICAYYNKKILGPFRIFDNQDSEKAGVQNYGAYASIYDDTDIITVYEFSNDYAESGYGTVKQVVIPDHDYTQEITTSFLRLNKKTGMLDEISRIKAIRNYSGGEYEFSFRNGDGTSISEADYRECFKENIGEDNYRRFFIDEMMIADSEYSFRSEYLWNSRPSEEHLSKEKILLRLKS